LRVLIIGGAGMLGHKLAQTLPQSFEAWVTLRRSVGNYACFAVFDAERTITGVDVMDFDTVSRAVDAVRPDAVINCVGIIKQLPAANDPIPSITINSLLPHKLHQLCRKSGARLIHISTDCVFRGDRGMYTESDPSDALDLYGRSKFLGETSGEGALTLRTSIIGRELESASGLVEWFLSNRGGSVRGFRRAIYTGFTTIALARIIAMVLEQYPDLHGTLQVSSGKIDKYELLLLLRQAFQVDVEIVPDDAVTIDRSLDSSRFRSLTGFVPPSWPDMVAEMASDPTPYDRWRVERGS